MLSLLPQLLLMVNILLYEMFSLTLKIGTTILNRPLVILRRFYFKGRYWAFLNGFVQAVPLHILIGILKSSFCSYILLTLLPHYPQVLYV